MKRHDETQHRRVRFPIRTSPHGGVVLQFRHLLNMGLDRPTLPVPWTTHITGKSKILSMLPLKNSQDRVAGGPLASSLDASTNHSFRVM